MTGAPFEGTGVRLEACDPDTEDARACMDAYVAELVARVGGGFDPRTATSLVSGPALVPPAGVLLIARQDGKAVGSAALTFDGPDVGTIHRMWVSPSARGQGVGRRLLVALEQYAVTHDVGTLRLETMGRLTEALALYRSAGYVDVAPFSDEPHADRWLAKGLGGHGSPVGRGRQRHG